MFRVIEGSLSIVDGLGNIVSTISGANGVALQIKEQNLNSDGYIQSTAHTYGQYGGSWMPFSLDDQGRLRIVSESITSPHTLSGTSHIGQLADWQIPDNITRDLELITVSGVLQMNIDDHISDVSIHRELDDTLTTNTNLWSAKKISQEIITATGTSGIRHNDLLNLDYVFAGHTGFVSTATAQIISGSKTFSSDVNFDDKNLNNTQRVSFEQRTTDVSSPDDGDVWYRNDTNNIRVTTSGLTNDVNFVKIIECYNTEEINVNVNDAVAISWGVEDFKDDLYVHSVSTNNSRVGIKRNGIYEIIYTICINNTNYNGKTIRARIRVNGSTYQDRGTSYSYSSNNINGKQSNTIIFPIILNVGDYIEVMCDKQGSSGTANTIKNESFVYIKLLKYL